MKIISISDVITNSSSEVFIIHGKPEFQEELNEEIPEVLGKLCELFGENVNDIMEFSVSDETYIDEGWYYYVHKGDLLIHSTDDNSIPGWLMDTISDLNYTKRFRDKFSGHYAKDLGEIDLPYYDWNHKPDEPGLKHRLTEIQSIQREHLG